MTDPWGLSDKEQKIIAAVVQVGGYKRAARLVGMAPKTVEMYMGFIRKKMGIEHQTPAAVAWDRWARESQ